jgi:hypothetical protein
MISMKRYSVNDLTAKVNKTKGEKLIKLTIPSSASLDEKIYTENDIKKLSDFILLKNVQNNPFCGKKYCPDVSPNHSHSERIDKKTKSDMLFYFKLDFFIDKWSSVTTEENELESEISKKLEAIFSDKNNNDVKKWKDSQLLLTNYIKNTGSHSPKLLSLEKKWRNKKLREEWLKSKLYWDQWQGLQLTVTAEKQNLFSSPATWILIVVVLSLAAIGWVFYRRRKKTKKEKN